MRWVRFLYYFFCIMSTSFPGSLFFTSPGARETDGNKRDPGNEFGIMFPPLENEQIAL